MFNLVCVHEFHGYKKGQMITDPAEIAKLLADRDHHFVKIAKPAPAVTPTATPSPVPSLGAIKS